MKCYVAAQADFRCWILQFLDADRETPELWVTVGGVVKIQEVVRIQDNAHLQALGRMCIQRKQSLLRLLFYTGCVYSNTLILIVELFYGFKFFSHF